MPGPMFSTSAMTRVYSPPSSPYTYTSVVDEPLFVTAKVTAPAASSVRSTSQESTPAAIATVGFDEESVPASPDPQETTNGESTPRNAAAARGRAGTAGLRSEDGRRGRTRGRDRRKPEISDRRPAPRRRSARRGTARLWSAPAAGRRRT